MCEQVGIIAGGEREGVAVLSKVDLKEQAAGVVAVSIHLAARVGQSNAVRHVRVITALDGGICVLSCCDLLDIGAEWWQRANL